MEPVTFDSHRERRTSQERTRIVHMDDAAHDDRLRRINIQERTRRSERDGEARTVFNEQHAMNQRRHRTFNQDRNVPNEEYLEFFSSCDDNSPLEDHPYVKELQDKFHKSMDNFEMRHCIICRERWMTKTRLDEPIDQYECQRCKTD